MTDNGSLFDPTVFQAQQERQAVEDQQRELMKAIDGLKGLVEGAAQRGAGLAVHDALNMRLELLIEFLWPAHLDDEDHDPEEPPTNPERIRLELQWVAVMTDAFKGIHRQMLAAGASPLVIPSAPVPQNLFGKGPR